MHSKQYVALINSKRWKVLRVQKLTNDPLCEVCKSKGLVVSATCVHHIVPVESARTQADMEQLAFSYLNLQSLCYKCHNNIHNFELFSFGKKGHIKREKDRLELWISRRNKDKKQ